LLAAEDCTGSSEGPRGPGGAACALSASEATLAPRARARHVTGKATQKDSCGGEKSNKRVSESRERESSKHSASAREVPPARHRNKPRGGYRQRGALRQRPRRAHPKPHLLGRVVLVPHEGEVGRRDRGDAGRRHEARRQVRQAVGRRVGGQVSGQVGRDERADPCGAEAAERGDKAARHVHQHLRTQCTWGRNAAATQRERSSRQSTKKKCT
jgi:hypothetical protein